MLKITGYHTFEKGKKLKESWPKMAPYMLLFVAYVAIFWGGCLSSQKMPPCKRSCRLRCSYGYRTRFGKGLFFCLLLCFFASYSAIYWAYLCGDG